MPTYGSLFSGVGGFDLGFDQAEYDCVFQVEWDKNCQQILAKHWPEVPKWLDVQDVNGAEIPPCDVLTFGSPCQDLSVAGKRAGLDGTKSSMFYEATRIIKEMRNATESVYPRIVVWENVPGALSSNNGADFGQVLDTLADIGAVDIQWSILDAQYFGVPQRRRRIFVIAIFDPTASDNCPETLLPVIQGSRGDFKKSRTARKNATGHATPSVDSSGQWAAGSTDEDILSTSVCSKWAKGSGGPSGSEHYNMVVEGDVYGQGSFGQFVEGQISTIRQAGGDLGGGSENLVVQEAFVKSRRAQSDTDDETWVEGDVTPTLNAFDNGGETRATVLMPVAYSIREDAKANTFSATETDTALYLNGLVPSTQSHHAQIFIAEPQPPFVFDGTRHDDFRMDTETVPTLKQRMGTGGGQVPILAFDPEIVGPLTSTGMTRARGTESVESNHVLAVHTPMLAEPIEHRLDVRRLTPLECERLQGWPDDHTRWTADGKEQADTNRYKQCGNGVATPVAKWIAEHIKAIL